jgi:hypothetical protein
MNFAPCGVDGFASYAPQGQNARSASRRAQFQLWIFSYTFRAWPSKNMMSRLRFISFSKADKQKVLGCFTGNTHRAAPWARFIIGQCAASTILITLRRRRRYRLSLFRRFSFVT